MLIATIQAAGGVPDLIYPHSRCKLSWALIESGQLPGQQGASHPANKRSGRWSPTLRRYLVASSHSKCG